MYLMGSFTTSLKTLDVSSPRSASSSLQIQSNHKWIDHFSAHFKKVIHNNKYKPLTIPYLQLLQQQLSSFTAIGRKIFWGMSLPSRKILYLHMHLWETILQKQYDTRVLLIHWGHSPSHFLKNVAKVTTLPTITCIIISHACTRGKVIGSVIVVIVVVMDTKISWSQHLGTWATCKHNEYVKSGDKLASVCSESSGMAYKRHKYYILVGHHSHTHRPCPLCMCFLLMCTIAGTCW